MGCHALPGLPPVRLQNRGPLDLFVIEEAVRRYRPAPAPTRLRYASRRLGCQSFHQCPRSLVQARVAKVKVGKFGFRPAGCFQIQGVHAKSESKRDAPKGSMTFRGAAAELENYLGGTLQRAPQGSSVDFVFSSGPNNGKTVDFMLTPDTVAQATKINQFFDKNLNNFMSNLSDHAVAADFVPLDSRLLSETNKTLLTKAIGDLPQKLQAKIILIK